MSKLGLPPKQGLYDPRFEHDACGVGFVVNMHGQKSHEIVHQGLTVLNNLRHRGACGAEINTGDGAGILLQIPHAYLKKVAENIQLPEKGDYAVGMIYLSPKDSERKNCEKKFEEIVTEEGQKFLGWRTVPTNNTTLGNTAKSSEPIVRQAFVAKAHNIQDEDAFERKLYVIRKRAENLIRYSKIAGGEYFYVSSFSSRTIVYKGMLMSEQVGEFFPDLADDSVESAIALVHSRFSTNTFPSWDRAHPYRFIAHNGEINTLRGNINWMKAREAMLESELFKDDLKKLFPIVHQDGSDSQIFDNVLEFLVLSGRSLPHAVMMMIPEPWSKNAKMDPKRKAFYEYHSALMEPWDGPASIAFTDGHKIGAILDRNGLRPSRYYVTKDGLVVMASEVGVLDISPSRILQKGRLQPGKMFLVDTLEKRIIADDELKDKLAKEYPYDVWLNNLTNLKNLPDADHVYTTDHETVYHRQKAFGYTFEQLRTIMAPMAKNGVEATGSMCNDTPLAVLSDKSQLLFNYFKQLFAQVTNPPIDAIREDIVTASETNLGPEGNLLKVGPENCRQIRLESAILSNEEMAKLRHLKKDGYKTVDLPILFNVNQKDLGKALEKALDDLFAAADRAVDDGANLVILSDRGVDKDHAPIPSLLATAGLHHHLVRNGKRNRVGILLESGEPREVHHFCLLIGYGAGAINPYLAFETLDDMIGQKLLTDIDHKTAVKNFLKSSMKGVIKVMSKMGISSVQSYRGAQIFEAVGLNEAFVEKYFTSTPSRIGGIGLEEVAQEVQIRHEKAFTDRVTDDHTLDVGGDYQWRKEGEYHLFNPQTVHNLQLACRTGNYQAFKVYSHAVDDQSKKIATLRGLLDFKKTKSIPIEEVQSVEEICKRFKTGAMSYGSISKEAHESLAIAMNRIGGKSNTGEGGEDPSRYTPDANGDSRNSAIKQVASGRFGVTSHYLTQAKEIQIKMAQGAKPGEGGQLPGAKVYPLIAKVRLSTPGVGLISPPPHHDIYSIEDLAELIHDLKNSNTKARISVKLVSEVGVGTIAAGVAKAHADVVLISGYDGGTGASPQTSIKHAGLPWELGLAETHQTLLLNNLRSRIAVETDGQLKTGRDVAIAALLGAEEFGFATAPLVSLGCIMMRVCHLDTCPVGVATQNPALRKKFTGDPAHAVNFMKFVAQELREIMAQLGFRTINEMVGRTDILEARKAVDHWKAKGIDLSPLLHQPKVGPEVGRYCQMEQDHGIDQALDTQVLLKIAKPALDKKEKVTAIIPIKNVNRVTGTIVGSELTRRYGPEGLPEDTIRLHFKGSAGQSFGAFVPKGMSMILEGDANDYLGKGLSGGKLIVYPPEGISFVPEDNIIIGNVAFYGATGGEAYIRGMAGERFCVRNSGVKTVVEAVGDHGCEYMTGGRVVVLGPTGRNFAAGMSGGIAWVLDEAGSFKDRCNPDMVDLEPVHNDDIAELKGMIEHHAEYTKSELAKKILSSWSHYQSKFVRVIPKDYKRVLNAIKRVTEQGLSGDEAIMAAFEENKRDLSRVGGN
ncbi:MAG: glutamate synthase large subunit [Deltaproteobacteria bacterium]|nr:MAG: glutamate synthase large subunit [Deltaproteobacteria bacterium]